MTDVIVQDQDAAESSLYRRIGGEPAIAAAVDGLYERILADDELASYFSGVDLARLKAHQRAFLASALGGPVQYRGRPLDDGHRHLAITATAYDKVIDHIVGTLESLDVDPAVIDEVTAAVRSLQPQVVSADRP
jgi:hemoglobin